MTTQRSQEGEFQTRPYIIPIFCDLLYSYPQSFRGSRNFSGDQSRHLGPERIYPGDAEQVTERSVVPAKAGIQANRGGEQTWIPACAGMTSREERSEGNPPFSSSVGERKVMNHFVVRLYLVLSVNRRLHGNWYEDDR